MNHQPTGFATRAKAFEASENTPANLSGTRSFGEVVHARYVGRRGRRWSRSPRTMGG